jgi:ribosomal small subunit protein bTHX
MGKGDIKTEKGKRARGTYGKTRHKNPKFRKYTVTAAPVAKSEKEEETKTAKKAPAKKAPAKKTAAKATAKKTVAKKTTKKASAKKSDKTEEEE